MAQKSPVLESLAEHLKDPKLCIIVSFGKGPLRSVLVSAGVVNGSSKQAAGHTASAHLPTAPAEAILHCEAFVQQFTRFCLQPGSSLAAPCRLSSILFCFFKRFYSKLILKNKKKKTYSSKNVAFCNLLRLLIPFSVLKWGPVGIASQHLFFEGTHFRKLSSQALV